MRGIIREAEVLEMDIPLAMILLKEGNHCLENTINSLNRIGLGVIRRNGSASDSIFPHESS